MAADDLPSTPPRRVLLVDDNVGAAQMLQLLLSKLNTHEIQLAHDGPSSLRVLEEFRPEVVLLDIGLPGMDGYQVAQAIRRHERHNHVLLVAVTGYSEDEDRQRAQESGFDDYLVKPYSKDDLQKVFLHAKLTATATSREQAAPSAAKTAAVRAESAQAKEQVEHPVSDPVSQLIHELGNVVLAVGVAAKMLPPEGAPDVVRVKRMLEELERTTRELIESIRQRPKR